MSSRVTSAPSILLSDGLVRPYRHGVPAALPVLDLLFLDRQGVDHRKDHLIKVRHIDIGPDVGNRPPDIAGDKVQRLCGGCIEPPDLQFIPDQQDRDIDAAQDIQQVVVALRYFLVAVLELVVHGAQFFIGGLKLFLGRFQLLVDALQLFVAGLHFFIERLEFLGGRLIFRNDRLQMLLRGGKLAHQRAQPRPPVTGLLPLPELFPAFSSPASAARRCPQK